jgi:hypothetical protein
MFTNHKKGVSSVSEDQDNKDVIRLEVGETYVDELGALVHVHEKSAGGGRRGLFAAIRQFEGSAAPADYLFYYEDGSSASAWNHTPIVSVSERKWTDVFAGSNEVPTFTTADVPFRTTVPASDNNLYGYHPQPLPTHRWGNHPYPQPPVPAPSTHHYEHTLSQAGKAAYEAKLTEDPDYFTNAQKAFNDKRDQEFLDRVNSLPTDPFRNEKDVTAIESPVGVLNIPTQSIFSVSISKAGLDSESTFGPTFMRIGDPQPHGDNGPCVTVSITPDVNYNADGSFSVRVKPMRALGLIAINYIINGSMLREEIRHGYTEIDRDLNISILEKIGFIFPT